MKKLHVFTLGLSILALGVLASCSSKSKDTPTPPPSPSPQPQVEYLQKKVVTELFEDMQSFKQTTIYDATGRVVEPMKKTMAPLWSTPRLSSPTTLQGSLSRGCI